MGKKDWNRIGLAAAILLVPGGFLLGATLLARRGGKTASVPASDAPIEAATAVPNVDGQDEVQH